VQSAHTAYIKIMTRPILKALCAAFVLAAGLGFAPADALALSEQDRVDVVRIENYLDAIRSYRSAFFQIAPNGAVTEGRFVMERPGRLRFDYDPPSPIEIVADGTYLHYYDHELGQINSFAIEDTPIGVLVQETIRFDGLVHVTEVVRDPGVIRITLVDAEDPAMGSLTLVFVDHPLELRQWQVKDAQGLVTTVAFLDGTLNPVLDPALFIFDDPRDDLKPGRAAK
jgi:outer membrane lipoprotein-sorting protein